MNLVTDKLQRASTRLDQFLDPTRSVIDPFAGMSDEDFDKLEAEAEAAQ